jgi:hypothetical protein
MRDNDQEKSQSPDPAQKRRSRSTSNSSKNSNKSKQSRSSYSKSRSRSRSRSSEADGYRLHIADIGDDVRKSDLEKVFCPIWGVKRGVDDQQYPLLWVCCVQGQKSGKRCHESHRRDVRVSVGRHFVGYL